MKKILTSILATLILSSCVTHNTPTKGPNPNDPERKTAFVDQDGTFYPNNPEKYIAEPNGYTLRGAAHSLRQSSYMRGKENLVRELKSEEDTILDGFRKAYQDDSRIFILVHGFNNNETEANTYYKLIEDKIAWRKSDGLIRFHWDGLSSHFAGRVQIWNNASGYSALAGQFGLRRLLNQFHNKEIYLISHSRGASVILSALSNPRYFSTFERDTLGRFKDLGYSSLSEAPPLKDNGNKIRAIMFAPAIGAPDFSFPDGRNYRSLGGQLESISYTINAQDDALQKGFGPVSVAGLYNSTTLGYEGIPDVALKYPKVQSYVLSDADGHGLPVHVNSEKFPQIMREAGIQVR